MKFVPLKNVLTFIRGVTFKPDDLLEQGDKDSIACLRTKNIQKELDLTDVMLIPTNIIEKNDTKILQKSDILISSANSWQLVGKCVRVPELPFPATLGGFISNLRAKPEVVNANYLYHWLVSPNIQHKIRHLGRQTTNISNLDRVRFLELKIPLPPLETQKQIAQVLETADQLRKDCQQVEQELNALAQSVFLEMFGDPVINPKGWKEQNFSGLIHGFKYGSSVKSGDQGTPILRIPNVTGGKISLSDLKHVLLSKNELEKNTLINGDILFVRTNGNRAYIGRSAVFDLKGIFVYASYLIRARVNEKLVTPYFITALLRTNSGREMLMKQAKTTAGQFNINTQGLGNLKIYIPPLSLQKRFESIFLLIEKQKDENRGKLKQFDDLFNALLQKAFKGELDLKSSEQV